LNKDSEHVSPRAVHELPQPPQFASLTAFCSQPSSAEGAAGVEQLAHPTAQLDVQRPPLHTRESVWLAPQPRPHAPQ
jgi:hypothetical protein